MRILLVADIHANWPALEAIHETYDACFCLGDLVDYALEPAPCLEWVRKHATQAIRGNHDHGVAQNVVISGRNGFKYLNGVTRALTRDMLSPEDLRFLGRLPVSRMVSVNGTRFLLVHASPRDPLDEYAPADVEFWRRRLENVAADVICVGHTHQPYVLRVDGKTVVNPGSVGQPRDGDPRASYAIIDGDMGDKIDIKRIEYPVESAAEKILTSSMPEQARERLVEILRTGAKTAM
jgi:putative phosphoesterase